MKKILTSVTFLFMLATTSNAADTKQAAINGVLENKTSVTTRSTTAAETNYVAVLEENTKLRLQANELSERLDNLANKLNYSEMMHATISNLQNVVLINSIEDATCQMDYARMMNATLINLAVVSVNTK